MRDLAVNNAMLTLMALAAAMSLAAGFFLFQRHVDGQPLLPYEPRRRVPWGPLVLLIPFFFVGINFLPLLLDFLQFLLDGEPAAVNELKPDKFDIEMAKDPDEDFLYGGTTTSLLMIGFVVIAVLWLLAERRADWRDLGLPNGTDEFQQDCIRGFVACLAAMLPIFAINYVLFMIFEPQQVHPLIEHLAENHSLGMMLVGILSAVIAAPLFEEFTFRVLLQGWLERIEDERLNYAATLREPVEVVDELAETYGESLAVDPALVHAHSPRPPHGWISALPHGWTPILVSAIIFGLAHVGHGVAPVPLVFLGIVLGYLYQRTHRIMPSIAAHALFNAYSLTLLWLQIDG